MKANDLFALMPRPLSLDIIEFTHANDREVYAAMIELVAKARKVRPVFIQRQPKSERFDALAATLGRPNMEVAAENLIRNWLLKKHPAMLSDFLDALGISHEKGVVENLPDTVEDAALHTAVEKLLGLYPQDTVAIYLYAFSSMNEARWKNLDQILAAHPKLQFDT